MVSETKIDGSFPNGIFLIHGFSSPYRLDRISKGILSNLLATDKEPIGSFYVELNLWNEKYLINCSYNLHKTIIKKPWQH